LIEEELDKLWKEVDWELASIENVKDQDEVKKQRLIIET
jgi:hypothetical protein